MANITAGARHLLLPERQRSRVRVEGSRPGARSEYSWKKMSLACTRRGKASIATTCETTCFKCVNGLNDERCYKLLQDNEECTTADVNAQHMAVTK